MNRDVNYQEVDESMISVNIPRMDISSSLIRNRVKNKQPINILVPRSIHDYIERKDFMKIDKAIELLKINSEKRFKHSLRVAETAVKLAEIYDGDKDKANLAGVLHDYCKYDDLSTMYQIVRQHDLDSELLSYGGEILQDQSVLIMQSEFGIEDEEVLLAIKNHTTGRKK